MIINQNLNKEVKSPIKNYIMLTKSHFLKKQNLFHQNETNFLFPMISKYQQLEMVKNKGDQLLSPY